MMSIFFDMVQDNTEVFMDEFSVVGNLFDDYLVHLSNVIRRHLKFYLVLNWVKCDFIKME